MPKRAHCSICMTFFFLKRHFACHVSRDEETPQCLGEPLLDGTFLNLEKLVAFYARVGTGITADMSF